MSPEVIACTLWLGVLLALAIDILTYRNKK